MRWPRPADSRYPSAGSVPIDQKSKSRLEFWSPSSTLVALRRYRETRHGSGETVAGAFAAVLVGLAAALIGSDFAPTSEATICVSSAALVALFYTFGKRDLTRPHVLLPLVWFSAVAVSQLKLLDYETSWSSTTTFVVFAGPLAFAAGSALVSNSAVRPTDGSGLGALSSRRLAVAGSVLFAVGIAGVLVKSRLTGGLPLLAEQIDAKRSAGGIRIPAYVTFLTDCTFLSSWTWMLRFYADTARSARWVSSLLVIASLGVTSLSGSRNTLLTALLVPVLFAYLTGATRRLRPRTVASLSILTVIVLLVSSGLFFLRSSQHQTSRFESYFYADVVQQTEPALRPLLPIYIGLATPLETLNRLVQNDPNEMVAAGTYFFPSIPPQISPFTRGDFYDLTAALSSPYYFNVATYQGSVYADGGAGFVLVMSLIMGCGLGSARWFLLRRASVASLAIVAYLAYATAFLFYENLFTFYALAAIWDIVVMWIVLSRVSGEA